jgi:hypothetical protein
MNIPKVRRDWIVRHTFLISTLNPLGDFSQRGPTCADLDLALDELPRDDVPPAILDLLSLIDGPSGRRRDRGVATGSLPLPAHPTLALPLALTLTLALTLPLALTLALAILSRK